MSFGAPWGSPAGDMGHRQVSALLWGNAETRFRGAPRSCLYLCLSTERALLSSEEAEGQAGGWKLLQSVWWPVSASLDPESGIHLAQFQTSAAGLILPALLVARGSRGGLIHPLAAQK